MFNELWKNNLGVWENTGKKFGDLMLNFVLGLDEACIMADYGGNIGIIGASDRKKATYHIDQM